VIDRDIAEASLQGGGHAHCILLTTQLDAYTPRSMF
jgi:hypothetical protein